MLLVVSLLETLVKNTHSRQLRARLNNSVRSYPAIRSVTAFASSEGCGGVSSAYVIPKPPPRSSVRMLWPAPGAIRPSQHAIDASKWIRRSRLRTDVAVKPTTSIPGKLAAKEYTATALSQGMPNLLFLSPVAIYGCVLGSTSGLTRSSPVLSVPWTSLHHLAPETLHSRH